MMSGASMWLDARAGVEARDQEESDRGGKPRHLAKWVFHVTLLRDCWLMRCGSGEGCRAPRAAAWSEGTSACENQRRASARRLVDCRDDAGVEEQARVPGVFGECAVHGGLRFTRARPAAASAQARASSVNTSRRTVSSRSASTSACGSACAPRRQEERDRPRIGRRPVACRSLFDGRRPPARALSVAARRPASTGIRAAD